MRATTLALELSEARGQGYYNIGEAAAASGVSAKMIRHYEEIGLMPEAVRTFANYRIYTQKEIHTLQFIRRARLLGFSIPQIRTLVNLWQEKRPSKEVKRLALAHIEELETKIRELETMKKTLEVLAEHCHGDHRPDCPILEDLAGEQEGAAQCH